MDRCARTAGFKRWHACICATTYRTKIVERGPDAGVIVAVGAAGEGDAAAGGSEHLGIGPPAGGEKFAAVDNRRGQGAVIDHRSSVRAPGGTGRGLVEFGGTVADEFGGIAAFDQADALAIELDRLDLGAVLFGLVHRARSLRRQFYSEYTLSRLDISRELLILKGVLGMAPEIRQQRSDKQAAQRREGW